jgi:hypothetical protein
MSWLDLGGRSSVSVEPPIFGWCETDGYNVAADAHDHQLA